MNRNDIKDILLSCLLGGILLAGGYFLQASYEKQKLPPVDSNIQEQQEAKPVAPQKEKPDYADLERNIMAAIGNEEDNYSVYIARGDAPENPLLINNQIRRSASMIKVFIMEYAMDLAYHHKLSLDDTLVLKHSDKVGGAGIICGWSDGTAISLNRLLELMITESDNTATNMLIDYLGMDNINGYIQQQGYSETTLNRKMMDMDSIAAGRENYTSVKDLGSFFSNLAAHRCVSEEYDARMIEILLGQTDVEVIPAALPELQIAHKTGELGGLYDDGGIIYGKEQPYILVMMNDDIDRSTAVYKMRKIARLLCGNT